MSDPMALENAPAVHGWERLLARLAVAGAWPLTKLSPRRLRRVLTLVHRGAAPATYGQALAARESVVAVSVRCAGQGCLHRALATALLCRMRGYGRSGAAGCVPSRSAPTPGSRQSDCLWANRSPPATTPPR